VEINVKALNETLDDLLELVPDHVAARYEKEIMAIYDKIEAPRRKNDSSALVARRTSSCSAPRPSWGLLPACWCSSIRLFPRTPSS
jgi:hypothetical protein